MSKPTANPFFEADFSKIMDVSKIMGEFKIPGFNLEALLAVQRKNIEAITAVNQAAFESFQSIAHRQAELARQSWEDTSNFVNSIISATTPEEKVVRQAEASKAAVEKAMANVREIGETVAKCNYQAMETVSNRLSEGLEELRGIIRSNSKAA